MQIGNCAWVFFYAKVLAIKSTEEMMVDSASFN